MIWDLSLCNSFDVDYEFVTFPRYFINSEKDFPNKLVKFRIRILVFWCSAENFNFNNLMHPPLKIEFEILTDVDLINEYVLKHEEIIVKFNGWIEELASIVLDYPHWA